MTRIDYEAVNRRGVVLCTFGELALARKWVREHAVEHDGLEVHEVRRTTERKRVYRPNLRLVEAAS